MRDPGSVGRCADALGDIRGVERLRSVVGSDLTRSVPGEVHRHARHDGRLSEVRAGERRLEASRGRGDVRRIDLKAREDLELDVRVRSRAADDVRLKERPRPGLGNAWDEILKDRKEALELAESHLLASLGGDRREQERGGRFCGVGYAERNARSFKWPKNPNTPDSPQPGDVRTVLRDRRRTRELLGEVDGLADGLERPLERAGQKSALADHVGDQARVALLLVGEELDQEAVLLSDALCFELGVAEIAEDLRGSAAPVERRAFWKS